MTKLLDTTGIPERDICKRVLAKLSDLFNQLVDEYGAKANSPGGQPAARSAAAGVAGEGVGAKDRGAEARSLAQHSPASPPPPPFCSPLPPPGTVGARLEPQRQESDDRTPAGAGQPPAGASGGGTTCGASDPHNAQPKVNAAEQAPVAFIEDEHARAGAATPMSSAEGDEGEASRQEALGCGGSGDSPFASPAAAPRAPHDQRRSSNGQPQAGSEPACSKRSRGGDGGGGGVSIDSGGGSGSGGGGAGGSGGGGALGFKKTKHRPPAAEQNTSVASEAAASNLKFTPASVLEIQKRQPGLKQSFKGVAGVVKASVMAYPELVETGTGSQQANKTKLKHMNEQFIDMQRNGRLGTGLQEVGADKMWVVQHQKINGDDVGAGVVGKDIPARRLLCEYVGTVMTYDEARVITSDYDLEFPEPLADMVIDAGPPREGGRAESGAVCIAGMLNDSIKIKPRSQPRRSNTNCNVSSISNGQGNSRYKCTDGDGSAANCAFITAHCNGCSAVPSELDGRKHLHRLIYTTRAICSEREGEPLLISYGPHYWPTQIDRMVCVDLEKEVETLRGQLDAVQNQKTDLDSREAEVKRQEDAMKTKVATAVKAAVHVAVAAALADVYSRYATNHPPEPSTSAAVGDSG